MSEIEPNKKIVYIVEIGSADFYFDTLQQASEFFATIVKVPVINVEHDYSRGYWLSDKKLNISMKQETILLYPNKKALDFAKSQENPKE